MSRPGRKPNSVKALENLAPIMWKGRASGDWAAIAETYRGMGIAFDITNQHRAAEVAQFLKGIAYCHAHGDYAVPSQGGLFGES